MNDGRTSEEPVALPADAASADPAPADPAPTDAVPADAASAPARRRQYRSRSERRTYRRAVRRRRLRNRLGLVVGPVLVVIAVIVVLLTLLGGPEADGNVVTTLPAEPAGAGRLLVVEQDDAAPVMVLLHPRDTGGVALAMPGPTLLKTAEGFKTLAELHLSDQGEALQTALAEALGVGSEPMAAVEWSDLRGAMIDAGIDDIPPEALVSGAGEARPVARALLALIGASASGNGATAWTELRLGGDSKEFREAVSAVASAVLAGEWDAAELTGKLVEGVGFEYLEPDVEAARALLAGTAEELTITLQVQNGSGVVGIAQEAGDLLAALGYTMLPAGNSKDFPNVERTRITVSPDAAGQGARVRAVLGVGTIIEDAALGSGNVVVVLGKDYVPPVTTDATAG